MDAHSAPRLSQARAGLAGECPATLLGGFLLASTALVPVAALAGGGLPEGGQFAAGSGTIATSGAGMEVVQTTATGIVTWNSFSIGAGNSVRFDNGAGATLNRVAGNVPSRIDGNLSATGSLFLINPAGVVVGTGGRVATGGSFVAATQDLPDADFLDGGSLTFAGTSTAQVVNAGTIRSAQGNIALIARRVENTGTLVAPNGTAGLAAGYRVVMKDGADAAGLLSVALGGPDTAAVNAGTIRAASAEIRGNGGNVYALAGNTRAVVRATGVAQSGGRIFLTAGAGGRVRATGRLVARRAVTSSAQPAFVGGDVTLSGDDIAISGTIDVSAQGSGATGGTVGALATAGLAFSGTIDARGGDGGTGGFVETSGATVSIADTARVTTLAPGGAAGTWLIDPNDLTIAAVGGDISGATIAANLAGGNVTLSSDDGASAGNGDIFVNDAISWSADTTLTLKAARNIEIDAAIDGPNGGLKLSASGTGSGDRVGTISTGAAGTIETARFRLDTGAWVQIGATLPSFSARDFSLSIYNATFIRARGGDGTIADPYQLFDVYGLQGMTPWDKRSNNYDDYGVNYRLVADIDASPTVNWNGGAGFAPVDLGGSIDGNGHVIDGLFIDRPGQYAALISYWSDQGTNDAPDVEIKDLSITHADITGGYAGVLFAAASSGFVAAHDLSNIYVSGSVTGSYLAGGVAAQIPGNWDISRHPLSTVSDVHADVTVTSTSGNAGGLFGEAFEGVTILNSSSTGSVSAVGSAGGLVGNESYGLTIRNSFSTADVTSEGPGAAGGLVGYADGAEISNSFHSGMVSGRWSGGIVGYSDRGLDVRNVYASGAVSGPDAGGLVGVMSWGGVVADSLWDVETTGQSLAVGAYPGALNNVDGVTSAAMMQLSTFTSHGFDVDAEGGTGAVWRIYPGHTAPLLRSSLTGLTVTGGDVVKLYDGDATSADVGTLTFDPATYDGALVLGTASYTAASAAAGSYAGARLVLGGLYSTQFGYDIRFVPGTLTIAVPAGAQVIEEDRLLPVAAAQGGGAGACEPGVIGDREKARVHPCNSRPGVWLSAAAGRP